jgi:hypothetical protein
MRRRGWKVPVLAVALASLAGASPAMAQDGGGTGSEPPPAGQPPPAGPAPPDLIVSGRDVRMTRAGYGHFKIGCRQTSTPGEACLGTLVLRLAEPVTIEVRKPGSNRTQKKRLGAIQVGTGQFQTSVDLAQTLTIRFPAVFQRALRDVGALSVQAIGTYVGKNGAAGTTKRFITVYFPKKPPVV